jgi:hypothetical protein
MQLPQHVLAIRDRYVAAFPVPSGGPNPADEAFENRCRVWIRGLAEQVVFETQDPSWGCKNAGGGRPQSKDALAKQQGASLLCWDMLSGVGTGSPTLVQNPGSIDITGQTFMPVQGKDNIHGSTGGGGTNGGGGGDSDAELEALKRQVAIQGAQIQGLQDQIARLEAQGLEGRKIALRNVASGFLICADGNSQKWNLRDSHNQQIRGIPTRILQAFDRTSPGDWEEFIILDRGRE